MWRQALLQLKDVMSAAEPGYSIAPVLFIAASLILACAEPAVEAPARAPAAETGVTMEEEHAEVAPNVQTPLKGAQPAGGTSAMTFRIRNSRTGHAMPANVTLRHVEADRTGSLVDLSPSSSMDSDEFGRAQFNLPPGEHLIEVSAPGYQSISSRFSVEAGKTPLPMTFELDPVSEPEELLPEVVAAQKRQGHFLLLGYVVNAPNWQPLSGVQVQMSEMRAVTDEKGYFMLRVPVPPQQDGEVPRKDAVFERSGYKQHVLRNVSLWEEGDLITRIEMEPSEGTTGLDSLPK
jgi:Carboxypeptidase regulatory-like domain